MAAQLRLALNARRHIGLASDVVARDEGGQLVFGRRRQILCQLLAELQVVGYSAEGRLRAVGRYAVQGGTQATHEQDLRPRGETFEHRQRLYELASKRRTGVEKGG